MKYQSLRHTFEVKGCVTLTLMLCHHQSFTGNVFGCKQTNIMILSFRTDRSGQTVQTQIRLLLSDGSGQTVQTQIRLRGAV